VAGGSAPQTPEGGYLLQPTVFADIAPDAVLAQEEIFGPVLAIIKVNSYEEGLAVANNTEYGSPAQSTPRIAPASNMPVASFTWAISI